MKKDEQETLGLQEDESLTEAPVVDDDDADIDIYGGSGEAEADVEGGESDYESAELDGDEEEVPLSDLDDTEMSDTDPEMEGESDPSALIDQLEDLLSRLKDEVGGDELEGDEDGLEADDEMEGEDENPQFRESADDSAWRGKMQTLKAPAGQDGSQIDIISDPTVAKSSKKAKSLPGNKKVTGKEGTQGYAKDVLGSSDKANKATSKTSLPNAKAIADVVQKMLSGDTRTIQALYKGQDLKKRTVESLDVDLSEEMTALSEIDESLSEAFLETAQGIFEEAVKAKVEDVLESFDATFALSLSEEADRIESDLTQKLDEYLGYMAENYFEENKVAIEEGVAHEINESFMAGMRNLFEEHYIEVPKGKEDLVEKLKHQLDESQNRVKVVTQKAIGFRKEARNLRRDKIVTEAKDGLSMNEGAQLAKLAEDLEFDGDTNKFAGQVQKLKESHFGRTVTQTDRDFDALATDIIDSKPGNSAMDQYVQAINKTRSR